MKTKIPPPLVAFLSALAMWGINDQFPIGHVAVPGGGAVATLLALVGLVVVASAMRDFRKAGTTVNPLDPSLASNLVSVGIYSRSRNPMYVALLVLLTAWGVWLGNMFNIGILFLFVWFITAFQIEPEEEALRQLFGQQYEAYCKTVRRWF